MIEHPYVYFAQAAFTVWMLVDAYRRPAESFWLWVIFLFQPVGPWVYFFAVKIGDFGGLRGLFTWQRRPSLEELRYRAEQTPTVVSRLELAERLRERGEHAEAIPLLEAAKARDPEHCQVLFSLASCYAEQGRPDAALPLLEQIRKLDRAWSNWTAWQLMIAVQAQNGDSATALVTCRELVRLAPTLQHRCLLAERLVLEGKSDEAHDLLDQALEEHRFAPAVIRRRNRHWAGEAKRLLKRVSS